MRVHMKSRRLTGNTASTMVLFSRAQYKSWPKMTHFPGAILVTTRRFVDLWELTLAHWYYFLPSRSGARVQYKSCPKMTHFPVQSFVRKLNRVDLLKFGSSGRRFKPVFADLESPFGRSLSRKQFGLDSNWFEPVVKTASIDWWCSLCTRFFGHSLVLPHWIVVYGIPGHYSTAVRSIHLSWGTFKLINIILQFEEMIIWIELKLGVGGNKLERF